MQDAHMACLRARIARDRSHLVVVEEPLLQVVELIDLDQPREDGDMDTFRRESLHRLGDARVVHVGVKAFGLEDRLDRHVGVRLRAKEVGQRGI